LTVCIITKDAYFFIEKKIFYKFISKNIEKKFLHPYCLFILFKKFLKEGMKKWPSH